MAEGIIKRKATFCECGDHCFVNLTKWAVTMVSPQDASLLQEHNWHLVAGSSEIQSYAASAKQGRLHRKIIGSRSSELVDHENHNGLDNRRPNLRVATPTTNQFNKRKQRGKCSKFKGVRLHSRTIAGEPYWRAAIGINGKETILGHFRDEVSAAKMYDEAATRLFGEFAATNLSLGLLV
ncbi:hypothetical protein [Rhizobium sp. NZLR11]|uniref:hypothetical protein n=1 Tax=Rhizobium sp. NZLR11 TaxID=2731098 RepID=UPI001C8285E7|nr:hypothetical protein [Rhizobium sp. NZLR11]MBX5206705.1 hypothetical protein [Rhizobium sp. NZLR11]